MLNSHQTRTSIPTGGPSMLRSLVAPTELPEVIEEGVLRRNLTRESLEVVLEEDDCIMWLDCIDPTSDELQWIEEKFQLHPAVVSDLKRKDRRPTLHIYPTYVFLSLFQPRSTVERVEAEEVHCIMGDRYFITVRGSESKAVYDAYDRATHNLESWRTGVVFFAYLTAQFIIDSYYPILDKISLQLDNLEAKVMAQQPMNSAQQSVYRVKQQLISLRQMIAPQREVFSSMIGSDRLSKTTEDRDLFRHLYERLLRIFDTIDAQRDLAGNVLDLLESQESSRLANAVSRLTVFSMIFLPLSFLVGLFGLNFVTTEQELEIPLSGTALFMLIITMTLAISAGLTVMFRRKGWL
jgi:magnesium transporter